MVFSRRDRLLAVLLTIVVVGISFIGTDAQPDEAVVRHESEVRAIAFSPDGQFLATGATNGITKIWEVSASELSCKTVIDSVPITGGLTFSIEFSPDSEFLYTDAGDSIEVWSTETGERTRSISTGGLQHIFAINSDGTLLATTNDDSVEIRSLDTGQIKTVLSGHAERILDLEFESEGNVLLTGSRDDTARLWNVSTGETLHTLSSKADVRAVAVSPSGDSLATVWRGRSEAVLRVWNAETGEPRIVVRPDRSKESFSIVSLDYDQSGQFLVSDANDEAILWDLSFPAPVASLQGHEDFVFPVAFHPSGRLVASGSLDQTARLWDVSEWTSK